MGVLMTLYDLRLPLLSVACAPAGLRDGGTAGRRDCGTAGLRDCGIRKPGRSGANSRVLAEHVAGAITAADRALRG